MYQLKKMGTSRGTVTVMQDGHRLFRRKGVEISWHCNREGETIPRAHFRLEGKKLTRDVRNGVVSV